ncbi:MAG: UDP-forming cellulose synthase catalytic subunit [Nitrospirae bacterium]|nr:UDP-forming cellulose synthase catalytic subunit [Nitrospirota bacterium]MBF0535099.1 UDP-forming cellulose synthase catalytic subunit [Nitrospirota bacterium]MBF0615351.1 UDP-forming cellulose synthase catalytic subunit [Nitrospirota bacterium]
MELIRTPIKHFIRKHFIQTRRGYTVGIYIALGAAVLLYFHIIGLLLPVYAQAIVSWGLIAILIVFNRIKKFKYPPWRIHFMLIASLITLRYLYWRTFETLIYTDISDFMGMALLYLAELYGITLHFLSLFVSLWPTENEPVPLPADTALYPSVDIFIPTYNEPLELVKVTVIAALQVDYPKDKLHVYVLDDGGTMARRSNPKLSQAAWERHYEFRRMAREFGAGYITRERNIHAKAGNLNHAFGYTNSDLILILDCDHVPAKDILKNTVGYFIRDEKLAFVQTPHFFINSSTVEKNLAVFADAPAENEMFYRGGQPGLDFWNASFFCGSAAIMRRKYLVEVGGISGETITEDAETALSLHGMGYNSIYYGRPMVCGLSPETFDDFILQRSRWAQGMVQIFILKNPLFIKGLKFYQLICYINDCGFWFFGISRVIFYVAPAAFLLLNLKIFFASTSQVLIYALPHLLSSLILTEYISGKYRWPFFSDLFESVQSIYLFPAVIGVVLNPRSPSFKVTPKGQTSESESLSKMAIPFLIMTTIMFIAVPVAIIRWFEFPLYRDVIAVTSAWSVFNLILAMASLGAFFERRQVRRHHRLWANYKTSVYLPQSNEPVAGLITDLSLSGASVELGLSVSLKQLDEVTISFSDSYGNQYSVQARVQRIFKKGTYILCGCEFIVLNEETFKNIVGLVYGDSQRWVDFWNKRRKTPNTLRIVFVLLTLGITGTKKSFAAVFQMIFQLIKRQWKYLRPNRGTV